ncbi:MAG: beta-galactosidase, partial [Planctomycetota bacterium]
MARKPLDDYYVMMWTFPDPIFKSGPEKARLALERFREAGCNAAACHGAFIDPKSFKRYIQRCGLAEEFPYDMPRLDTFPFLENDFPMWVENICRSLTWDWEKGKPELRRQYETFSRERDRKVFVKRACLNDPEVEAANIDRLAEMMKVLEPARHLTLLYDLRDEPSACSFMLAGDVCFCEHCMKRMRSWLKERYADLAALNAEWGTEFASWNDVEPLSTQEAFERRESGDLNFSPWADHREFMDDSFARATREYSAEIKKHDPGALCGLEGTQCPWVFGGWDFARVVPELDWAEPYAWACSPDLYRSLKSSREMKMIKCTGLGGDRTTREVLLWQYVFQAGGYAGSIGWASNKSMETEKEDWPLTAETRDFAPVYFELRSGAPKLLQLTEELSSPVAVHHSQASVRADFITTVPNRWQSVAAAEPDRFDAFKCREAWWRLLEDRGLRPVFMTDAQIAGGELAARGIKVLVLPRSIAISDAEAKAMREFVEAGGTLLADSFAGRMDDHCRERETGALDELFGIKRARGDGYHASTQRASLDYDAPAGKTPIWGAGPLRSECALVEEGVEALEGTRVLGCTEYTDTPLGFLRETGKGRALLMNCAPLEYLRARRTLAGGEKVADFFAGALNLAGVEPEMEIRAARDDRPLAGWQVFPFAHGDARYFGVTPDLGATQDTLGDTTAEGGRAAHEAKLRFPLSGHLYEMRSGEYLGEGDSATDSFEAGSIKLYAVMPYRVEGLDLAFEKGKAAAGLKAGGRIGEHVLRFDLFDADG